ncbi:uncharacterized protein LOC116174172 isoform X2 [Photinus pyralis]|nr:uncharacterized protein LOC116174172 isoform X2 [Photinus pyralis]XP_031347901.1 uncharacterized protein LOC116174172 isoform X2 [Photinus pyralis]XP_031347902.1 uncharacterized protein LOC116174172 isoform X2 [Photinus pyralis]
MEVKDESENSEDEELNKHIKLGRHLFRRPTQLKLEGEIWNATESAEKFVQYLLAEKTQLLRHPTTLKMEGDMETKTENRDKYVAYENQIRPNLLKTDTHLHLEGNIDISTENRDKFLPPELLPRPPLAKRNTNLHMEGDMHLGSENRDKFIPLDPLPRPPLTKRGTNLHLEGDMTLNSEYRNIFVGFEELERIRPAFPTNNLKSDGFLQTETETSKFVKHDIQPVIPLLRNYDVGKRINLGDEPIVKKAEYKSKFVQHPKAERSAQRPKENLKMEGTLDVATENKAQFVVKTPSKSALKKVGTNLQLEGKLDLNPEYKNAYVNFYKDAYGKFGVVKDASSHRGRRQHLKSEGDMETNPEYKSAFVDFPRQRPSTRKPDGHMHTEGNISNMTEKRAQFIEHPASKPHLMKRRTELKLEGPFECYPEYRRAYIDYVTRDNAAGRQPRFPQNLNAQRRRVFDESIEGPPPAPAETTKKSVSLAVNGNRRHRSLSPASQKVNLSKVETRLFGPKLPHHNSSKSAPRPKPPLPTESERKSRASKRFGSPELIEDLAYVPSVDPSTQRIARYEDDRKRDKHSFVVLANIELQPCTDSNNNRFGSKQLFKEQKWMPSWYSTSSNK